MIQPAARKRREIKGIRLVCGLLLKGFEPSNSGILVLRRILFALTAAAAAALLSCSDNTGPETRPDAELNIVQQSTLAPPLDSTVVRLWAKVSDGREVRIEYQPPLDSAEDFLRFEVPGDALLRKPDGSPFQVGDSILITITVVDPARFLFRFEPSGLQFNPEHPARLKIHYMFSNHDFNHDGVVDSDDDAIEHILDLWQREGTTSPWFRVGSVKFEESDEIDANILSFSEYALAW